VQQTRPPACSRPTGKGAWHAGQGTRPGSPREVRLVMADPELDSAAEGVAAKTSWAKATQLSKRSAGFLANP
jgi:hypothetical protein